MQTSLYWHKLHSWFYVHKRQSRVVRKIELPDRLNGMRGKMRMTPRERENDRRCKKLEWKIHGYRKCIDFFKLDKLNLLAERERKAKSVCISLSLSLCLMTIIVYVCSYMYISYQWVHNCVQQKDCVRNWISFELPILASQLPWPIVGVLPRYFCSASHDTVVCHCSVARHCHLLRIGGAGVWLNGCTVFGMLFELFGPELVPNSTNTSASMARQTVGASPRQKSQQRPRTSKTPKMIVQWLQLFHSIC